MTFRDERDRLDALAGAGIPIYRSPAERHAQILFDMGYDPNASESPTPGPGHSPAYASGWQDAADGETMPAGCSPAYAEGYLDYQAAAQR